jgi:hypothetical protein
MSRDHGQRRGQINGPAANERQGEGLQAGGPGHWRMGKGLISSSDRKTTPYGPSGGIEEANATGVSMVVVDGAGHYIK